MGEYVYAERAPVFAGMDNQDIVALGELGMLSGQDRQDYLTFKALPKPLPNPAFVGLGQTGGEVAGLAAVGLGAMVVSAIASFFIMVGASYLGARWAGCRKQG